MSIHDYILLISIAISLYLLQQFILFPIIDLGVNFGVNFIEYYFI